MQRRYLYSSIGLHIMVFLLLVFDLPFLHRPKITMGQAPIIVDLKDVKLAEMTNLPPKAVFGDEDKKATVPEKKKSAPKWTTEEVAKPELPPPPKETKVEQPKSDFLDTTPPEPAKKPVKKPESKPVPKPAPKPAAKPQPKPQQPPQPKAKPQDDFDEEDGQKWSGSDDADKEIPEKEGEDYFNGAKSVLKHPDYVYSSKKIKLPTTIEEIKGVKEWRYKTWLIGVLSRAVSSSFVAEVFSMVKAAGIEYEIQILS